MAAEIHNTSDFLNILPLGAEQRRNPVVLPNVAWVPVAQVDSCPHRTQKLELQNAKKQKKLTMLPCKRPGCDTWSVLLKRMFPGFIWRPIHRDAIDWSPDVCIENPTSYRRLRTFHRSLLKFVKVQQWIPGQENNSDLTFADVPSVCFAFTCCHWISLALLSKMTLLLPKSDQVTHPLLVSWKALADQGLTASIAHLFWIFFHASWNGTKEAYNRQKKKRWEKNSKEHPSVSYE